MITVTREKTRFYTGDVVNYKDANTSWLFEEARTTQDQVRRTFAAAGLVRALLDVPVAERDKAHRDSVDWAAQTLVAVRSNTPIRKRKLPMTLAKQPSVKGTFDSVSTKATETNRPPVLARLLKKYIGEDRPLFILGIGHGGVVTAADTHVALGDQSGGFYPVRFSRHKQKDDQPVISDCEMQTILDRVEGNAIVLVDDDRSYTYDTTIRIATNFIHHYIGDLVNAPVYGVTPVLGRHPGSFHPQIITSDGSEILNAWAWGKEEKLQDWHTREAIDI